MNILRLGWISFRYFFSAQRKIIYRLLAICFSSGIIVLLLVLGMVNALQGDIIFSLLEYDSFHVQISDSERILPPSYPGIESGYSFYDSQVLLYTDANGMVPATIRFVSSRFIGDRFSLMGEITGLVISDSVARRFAVDNDALLKGLLIPENPDKPIRGISLPVMTTVALPSVIQESLIGYYPLELVNPDEQEKTVLGVYLSDPQDAQSYKAFLNDRFPEYNIQTWMELNRQLLAALLLERMAVIFFMLLLFLVITYSMSQMFKRSVLERYQDIALFRSLGANMFQIQIIFFVEIGILSVICGVIGSAIALFLVRNLYILSEGARVVMYSIEYMVNNAPQVRPVGFLSLFLRKLLGTIEYSNVFFVHLVCSIFIFLSCVGTIKGTEKLSVFALLKGDGG